MPDATRGQPVRGRRAPPRRSSGTLAGILTLLAAFAAVLDRAGPWIATASTAAGPWSSSGALRERALLRPGPSARTLVFRAVEHDDVLKMVILPPDAPGAVALRLAHCAIRYRARLTVETEERRAAMRALLVGMAELADARLSAGEGLDVLGGAGPAGRHPFGPALLRSMLAPDLVEGRPGPLGWVLEPIAGEGAAVALDFQRSHAERLRTLVTPRDRAATTGFAASEHFVLTSTSQPDPPGADALRAALALLVQLRDRPELDPVAPRTPTREEMAWEIYDMLNVFLPAECSQACSFCGIKAAQAPSDGGDAVFDAIAARMAAYRSAGGTGLRVNGYDPLSYSRILDVLARARDLGYERADVYSPSTRLADRAFVDRVVAAGPRLRFYVPLYGVTPEVHDRVVDRDGAHALILRALDHLVLTVGASAVNLMSVATSDNAAELGAIFAYAKARGFGCSSRLPFPTEPGGGHYRRSAPRQRDVAGAVVAARRRGVVVAVEGLAPCVLSRAMREAGVPRRAWLATPTRRPVLPGLENRSAGRGRFAPPTVACPHAETCALAAGCAGEIYTAYIDAYGWSEFEKVEAEEAPPER